MDEFRHLDRQDFFQGIGDTKAEFLSLASRRVLKKNELVFLEGDAGTFCFYLEQGIVRIYRLSKADHEETLFLRLQGDMFGLSEILDSSPRRACAQALCPTVLYFIRQDDFNGLLQRDHTFVKRVISTLGRRIRDLGELVSSKRENVTLRVASLLFKLAYVTLKDRKDWESPCVIPIAISEIHLATMVSSTQQTVSVVLHKLQDKKYIELQKRQIILKNPIELLMFINDKA